MLWTDTATLTGAVEAGCSPVGFAWIKVIDSSFIARLIWVRVGRLLGKAGVGWGRATRISALLSLYGRPTCGMPVRMVWRQFRRISWA